MVFLLFAYGLLIQVFVCTVGEHGPTCINWTKFAFIHVCYAWQAEQRDFLV